MVIMELTDLEGKKVYVNLSCVSGFRRMVKGADNVITDHTRLFVAGDKDDAYVVSETHLEIETLFKSLGYTGFVRSSQVIPAVVTHRHV